MPRIEWLTPEGAPAPLRGKGSVEDTVSHLDPVREAVSKKAHSMGREADALLLQHRHRGNAHVEVKGAPPRKLDAWVSLRDADPGGKGRAGKNKKDRSAMSIEFGWVKKDGTTVVGLHILGGVMGRAIQRYTGPR
jgi:hypothetical protein